MAAATTVVGSATKPERPASHQPATAANQPDAAALKRSAHAYTGRQPVATVRKLVKDLAPSLAGIGTVVPDPATVGRVLSPTAVQLKEKDGKPGGAVISNLPLAVPPADAGKPAARMGAAASTVAALSKWQPADLDWNRPDGGRLTVRRAAAPVSLPGTAGGTTRIGDLRLNLAPAISESAATVSGQSVTYPQIDTDTDLVVRSLPVGLDVGWLLRSPSAPTTLRVPLKLDDGEVTETVDASGAVTIRDAAGRVVGGVTATRAIDAVGAPVRVSASIDGDALVLRVDHREGQTQYPVMVDPAFSVFGTNWDQGSTDFQGWRATKSQTSAPFSFQTLSTPGPTLYSGLTVLADRQVSPAGTWGAWARPAPGDQSIGTPSSYGRKVSPEHAYWTEVSVTGVDYFKNHLLNQTPPTGTFAFARPESNWGDWTSIAQNYDRRLDPSGAWVFGQPGPWPLSTSQIGTSGTLRTTAHVPGDVFIAGLKSTGNAAPPVDPPNPSATTISSLNIGSIQLTAQDDVAPTISVPTDLTHWLKGTDSVRVASTDRGTGVAQILLADEPWSDEGAYPSSAPAPDSRPPSCPASGDVLCTYAADTDFPASVLPEGRGRYQTLVTDGGGQTNLKSLQIAVDRSAPTGVIASGELLDLKDTYTNGQGIKTVTVAAHDPESEYHFRLSGIRRLALEDVGRGVVAQVDQTCDPQLCPTDASATFNVDTAALAEGAHQFRVVATDLAGNVTNSAPWTVLVDRTGPAAPNAFQSEGFEPSLGQALLSWSPGVDPDLAVDLEGSQVEKSLYRVQLNGVWSAWQETDDDGVAIPGVSLGQQLTIEARSIDLVGNQGPAGSATLVVQSAVDPSGADGNVVGTGPHDLRVTVRRSVGNGEYDPAPSTLMTATSTARKITVRANEAGVATFPQIEPGTYQINRAINDDGSQQIVVVVDGSADEQRTYTIDSPSELARAASDGDSPLAITGDLRVWCATGQFKDVDTPGVPGLYPCHEWLEDSDLALYLEKRLFDHRGAQDSTRANAFRHMVWNALMVGSIYSSPLISASPEKYQQALVLSTDVYEYEGRRETDFRKARASTMDRHNNRVGWGYMSRRTPDQIGAKIPDFGICKRIRRLVGSVQKATYKAASGQFSKTFNRYRPVYYKDLDLADYRVRLKPQTANFDPCGPLKPGRENM